MYLLGKVLISVKQLKESAVFSCCQWQNGLPSHKCINLFPLWSWVAFDHWQVYSYFVWCVSCDRRIIKIYLKKLYFCSSSLILLWCWRPPLCWKWPALTLKENDKKIKNWWERHLSAPRLQHHRLISDRLVYNTFYLKYPFTKRQTRVY